MSFKINLLFILLLSTNLLFGQRGARLNPEQRAYQMRDSLLLSEAQTNKLIELFTESQEKMLYLRDSLSAIDEDVRPAFMQVRREEQEALKKYLTKDQLNQWKAIRERRRSSQGRGPKRGN